MLDDKILADNTATETLESEKNISVESAENNASATENQSDKSEETQQQDVPGILENDADLEEMENSLEAMKNAAKNSSIEDNLSSEKTEQTEPEKKEEQKSSDSKAVEDPNKRPMVKVDAAYIESQPENTREILQGLKGKDETIEVDAKFLKNYIHSQLYIKNLESDKENLLKQPDLNSVKTEETDNQYINDRVNTAMKSLYPDRGENPEDIKQFESDLAVDNPRGLNKYLADEQNIRSNIENEVKRNIYMKQNQNEFAIKSAAKAQELFVQNLEKQGLNNVAEILKDKKIDFWNFDETGKNEQLNELIWDQTIPIENPLRKFGGNGNPNDFSDKNASYLIDPVKLMMRAVYKYGGELYKANLDKVAKESFEKGLKKEVDKEKNVPPSASASSSSSVVSPKNTNSPIMISEDMSVEEMEVNLEKLKNKILKKVNGS